MVTFSDFYQQFDFTGMRNLILQVAAVLLCLMVHEVCHGLAALSLGDPTAKQEHRLSFNPIRHLDPFGLIMMVVAGFGWAKPVPVDPRYFRSPKKGMALTALAGPVSNFIMAFLAVLFLNAASAWETVRGATSSSDAICYFLSVLIMMNIGLGIFNLIPFPPLDGSKVLAVFLPDRAYIRLMQLERYGMVLLMAVLWFGWLDRFLYAGRSAVLDWMLARSEFVYYGVLTLFGA